MIITGSLCRAYGFCAQVFLVEVVFDYSPESDGPLDFILGRINYVGGSALMICGQDKSDVHTRVTDKLPAAFEARNSHGDRVICIVHKGIPYKNIFTGEMLKEVRIEIVPRTPVRLIKLKLNT